MKFLSTTGIVLVAAVLLTVGCTTQVRKDKAEAPPPPKKEDPMAGFNKRFEAAYFAIACQASRGKDPLSSVMPIETPAQYLERIENTKGGKHDRAEKALLMQGFTSIGDFRTIILKMKSNTRYWQTIQNRYIDELIKCVK